MGSGQSSAQRTETFAIDANGKIARISRNKPVQTEEASHTTTRQKDHSEGNSTESSPDASLNQEQKTIPPPQSPITRSNGMQQQSGPIDQLRLREIDDILTRMKAKYKPNSNEMATKGQMRFENIENRLMHCYKVNKDQALRCATLAEEYRSYVDKQRAEILVRSAKA